MSALTGLRKAFLTAVVSATLSLVASSPALAQQKDSQTPAGSPVAWRDPGDISTRNLTYGPGSQELAPQAPFTFVSEDKLGASPKFKVTDARGVTWSVKLGVEAQTETVATRVVWSMGYFAEESYYLDRVQVLNLPKLSRGQEFVEKNGVVRGARFEPRRGAESRTATWDWEENPFVGTRHLNGLKVLMALLGNYDNRPENNLVVTVNNPQGGEAEARYVVSDIGATLGKVGGMGGKRSKNNLEDFRASKFVTGVEGGHVKFDFSTKPKGAGGFFAKLFNPGYAKSQAQKERVMKNIPVEDARWIGTQLSRLSDDQLRDAFRAAGYDAPTMEGYVAALRSRINQLVELPSASNAVAGAQTVKR
ncbi:MAG TPA: hypothetical protein VER32_11305 [Pyrinomonadaceae bacterium]|nr:hypothetical protein [Pyrinomonadaceae bacterium]